MNNQHQQLISDLSTDSTILLTSLLCTEDPNSWDEIKYTVICPLPLLTLEMALNRVISKDQKLPGTPPPQQINQALSYAKQKREQYLKIIAAEDEPTKKNATVKI